MNDQDRSNWSLALRSSGEAGLPPWRLDPDSRQPLYRQIYESLRIDILQGRLAPGTRLAPTRVFAGDLGVSRNTVVVAFELLTAEGYLTGRTGSGTYVSRQLPERLLTVEPRASKTERVMGKSELPMAPRLSASAQQLCAAVTAPERPIGVPFRAGTPALDEFPFRIWNRIAARVANEIPTGLRDYGDLAGYRPLRVAIATALQTTRGVSCSPDEIVIVGGSQPGLDLVARVLLDPGDRAWTEDPGYHGMRAALLAAGAECVPVPVDGDGILVSEGRQRALGSRLACVTPSHQFPMGVTQTLARRLELLEWAREQDAWILEDDYDSEYRYVGRPLSPLKSLDEDGRVVYVGTFSKVLFPSLRIGYLVLPGPLVDPFLRMRYATNREAPLLEQAVLARFIEEGHVSRHVRRMRVLYGERQEFLRDAAERECGELLQIWRAETGIHVVGRLPQGADELELAQAAEDAGVVAVPLSSFALAERVEPGFVLGYAAFDEPEIRGAMHRLGRVLRKELR